MGAIHVRPPESTCTGPILCDFKLGREYVTNALSRSRSRPRVLPIQMSPSRSSKSALIGSVLLGEETPFALYRKSPRLVPTQMFESRSRSRESTSRLRREDGTPAAVKLVPVQRITPFAVPINTSEC